MTDLLSTLAAEDPARDTTPTAAEAARMDDALRRLVAEEPTTGVAGERPARAADDARVGAAGGRTVGAAADAGTAGGAPAGATPRRGARRRAWVLAPVALATAALSLGVALPGGKTPAVIAPAPANAAQLLADLRGKVVATSAATGRYAYQKQIAYVSHMRGGEERFVVVIPHELEQWVDADGSVIVRDVMHEDQATFPTPEDEAAYERAGQQRPPMDGQAYRHDDYKLAGFTVRQVAQLPTEPAALRAALERGDVALLPATAQLLASPVSSPELKAALFSVLKGLPGAELRPDSTDPRGRTGVGVQFEDDAWRTLFLFDPDSGALLGTRSIGKQEVPGRTIDDWWLVVEATRTDSAPTIAR